MSAIKYLVLAGRSDDQTHHAVPEEHHYGVGRRHRVARLQPDGSVETSFQSGLGVDSRVSAFAAQPDGKVVFGGRYTNDYGGILLGIDRINADGSPDLTFDCGTGPKSVVTAVASQPNGRSSDQKAGEELFPSGHFGLCRRCSDHRVVLACGGIFS